MARSKVSIANRALDLLGTVNIISLTDNSKNARTMNLAYEPVLESLLNKHDWHFAIERAELALLSASPLYEYTNAFQLPSDYIRVLEVYPKYLKYRIEDSKLLADATSVKIKYIRRINDPNKFTPEFAELLSLALAKETCYKITQSNSKEDKLEGKFKERFYEATSNDSKAAGTALPFADDVVMSHRGYGTDYGGNAVVLDDFDYGSVS